MKTSFEFEYQGDRVRAEYESLSRVNGKAFKLFSFRVLKEGTWIYQGTLSFPEKYTKKRIVENVKYLSYFSV